MSATIVKPPPGMDWDDALKAWTAAPKRLLTQAQARGIIRFHSGRDPGENILPSLIELLSKSPEGIRMLAGGSAERYEGRGSPS